jgi:hypothetical protein
MDLEELKARMKETKPDMNHDNSNKRASRSFLGDKVEHEFSFPHASSSNDVTTPAIVEQTRTISARRSPEDLNRAYISLPLPHRREGAGVAVGRSITIGWYHTCPRTQASQRRPPRARREIRRTMFRVDCHLPALLRPPPGGQPREGVGKVAIAGWAMFSLVNSLGFLFSNLSTVYNYN